MGGKTLGKRKRAATPFDTSAGEFFCRRAVQTVNKLLTPTGRQMRIPKLVQSGRSNFYPTGQLFTLRNMCFATRPIGDDVAQNMFEQDSHSVPTNFMVAQLSRSADTFAVICFSRSFFCVAGNIF
jgi:hypothetical protein